MRVLIRFLGSAIAVLIADLLLDGVSAPDVLTGLWVAAVLGLLNTFVKPVLLLLTLPVTVVSLGLFILVINAAMVLLAARIVPGFHVESFWWALAFSIVVWAIQRLLPLLDGGERDKAL